MASTDALLERFLSGGVRTRALLLAQTEAALAGIRAALADLARPYLQGDRAYLLPAPFVLISATRL